MNVLKLTEYLSNDEDKIYKILETLDYENISYNQFKKEFRFARDRGRNPSSMRLNIETLNYICFSTNEKGNIYTLIMGAKSLTFPQALNYIAELFNLNKSFYSGSVKLPFGGFYKHLVHENNSPETSLKIYDEQILDEYRNKYNTLFLEDGISYMTQKKFDVGYDLLSNRITIPERTFDGQLCGIMGRSSDRNCLKEERWLPIIPCSRSYTLFGYNDNYADIKRKDICVILESEKSPMQLDSFNCHVGLATCGCNISNTQAKYIKSLMTKKTIVGYDEGLEEEYIREEAKKLVVNNGIYKNKVGYIWDAEKVVMNNKSSPSDNGKEKFLWLMKNCVKWL